MAPFAGCSTIYGSGDTPYMTRMWVGRLRLHIFHRGDEDDDCHDHPWGFWTFPLVSYVEEVLNTKTFKKRMEVVEAWRWHYRPATYAHRVLHSRNLPAPWGGTMHFTGYIESVRRRYSFKIITIVWRNRAKERQWGFWRTQPPRWVYWRDYMDDKQAA